LFVANFTDDLNISDPDVLATIAGTAGLAASDARAVLASQAYAAEVRAAEQLWLSRGIQSVPGIVVNQKWLISGGQPPEIFQQALQNMIAELKPDNRN
jgi:predicted DsbA family dithiol-disulfide isomerase